MTDIVVSSNEILSVLVLMGIFGLIATVLYKLYNVLNRGEICEVSMTVVILAIGIFAYIFVEIGTLINMTQDVDAILIQYSIYFWFARVLFILLWIFWFVELFLNVANTATEPLKRMTKRRDDRINFR